MIQKVAGEYKTRLKEIYGDQLSELILFGSYARGDQHEGLDLDFAVVLKREDINNGIKYQKISEASSGLSLKYGIMVSSLLTILLKRQKSQQGVLSGN